MTSFPLNVDSPQLSTRATLLMLLASLLPKATPPRAKDLARSSGRGGQSAARYRAIRPVASGCQPPCTPAYDGGPDHAQRMVRPAHRWSYATAIARSDMRLSTETCDISMTAFTARFSPACDNLCHVRFRPWPNSGPTPVLRSYEAFVRHERRAVDSLSMTHRPGDPLLISTLTTLLTIPSCAISANRPSEVGSIFTVKVTVSVAGPRSPRMSMMRPGMTVPLAVDCAPAPPSPSCWPVGYVKKKPGESPARPARRKQDESRKPCTARGRIPPAVNVLSRDADCYRRRRVKSSHCRSISRCRSSALPPDDKKPAQTPHAGSSPAQASPARSTPATVSPSP